MKNVKLTDKELDAIQKKANRFAGGNLSAWLRHAGMNYTPKQKDLT